MPPCRPITTAGFAPSCTPMFRNQADSQSNVWNTVQSALVFEGAPIVLDRTKIVVQRQFDDAARLAPGRAAAAHRRCAVGIGPERIFDMAFEHCLRRHDIPVAHGELALRPVSTN